MTSEEAWELSGLQWIPSVAVLKVLRNEAIKDVAEQKDEKLQKKINGAFEVLIGSSKACRARKTATF